MLSTVQMVILVVAVLIAGALCSIILYWLQKHSKQKTIIPLLDFAKNSTYGKMLNSDVAVDDIIDDFKLLN